MPAMTDGYGNDVDVDGFVISNFYVGNEKVSLDTASTTGHLYWDPAFDVTIQ
jgi:hypothetical protein